MIKFKLNNNPLVAKKIDINMTLNEVRKKLGQKVPEACLFVCSDGTEIERDDEEEFKLSDIAEKENNSTVIFLSLKEEEKETKSETNMEKPGKIKENSSHPDDEKEKSSQNEDINSNNKLNRKKPDFEKANNESISTDIEIQI